MLKITEGNVPCQLGHQERRKKGGGWSVCVCVSVGEGRGERRADEWVEGGKKGGS